MTTIVSAIYGASDIPHPQREQDVDVDWVMFTDDPTLEALPPWRVVLQPPVDILTHPCMAAKWYKLFPGALGDVIWIDGSIEVTSRSFARRALEARNGGLAVFKHPRRDCVYLEAEASIGAESQGGKYDSQPIMEQVEHYRTEGHPEHAGLYACGVIAWDIAATVELREAWWAELVRWTYQDQLSLPVVCRRLGVVPGVFPLPQISRRRGRWLENRWCRIWEHRSSSRTPQDASTAPERTPTLSTATGASTRRGS